MSPASGDTRDRDQAGRARNARARDELGRPLPRSAGENATLDETALPPSEALTLGQELLDTGRPFTAHEVFEAVWKNTDGPDRELWRALAQLAVGITHALRGNDSGARTLLQRSATTLAGFAANPPYGVDVDAIRNWASNAADDLTLIARLPRLVVGGAESGGEGASLGSVGE